MGQKITLQNRRAGYHSFGTELHFGPGETKEVDLAILMKYGERGALPNEIKRGEFKIINTEKGEQPEDFGMGPVDPVKPAPKPEPSPQSESELAALLSAPPAAK